MITEKEVRSIALERPNQFGATHLKAYVSYCKGGYNVFTGDEYPRGYYLTIQPVAISEWKVYKVTSMTSSTGIRYILAECKRGSKSGMDEACGMECIDELVTKFMRDHHLAEE